MSSPRVADPDAMDWTPTRASPLLVRKFDAFADGSEPMARDMPAIVAPVTSPAAPPPCNPSLLRRIFACVAACLWSTVTVTVNGATQFKRRVLAHPGSAEASHHRRRRRYIRHATSPTRRSPPRSTSSNVMDSPIPFFPGAWPGSPQLPDFSALMVAAGSSFTDASSAIARENIAATRPSILRRHRQRPAHRSRSSLKHAAPEPDPDHPHAGDTQQRKKRKRVTFADQVLVAQHPEDRVGPARSPYAQALSAASASVLARFARSDDNPSTDESGSEAKVPRGKPSALTCKPTDNDTRLGSSDSPAALRRGDKFSWPLSLSQRLRAIEHLSTARTKAEVKRPDVDETDGGKASRTNAAPGVAEELCWKPEVPSVTAPHHQDPNLVRPNGKTPSSSGLLTPPSEEDEDDVKKALARSNTDDNNNNNNNDKNHLALSPRFVQHATQVRETREKIAAQQADEEAQAQAAAQLHLEESSFLEEQQRQQDERSARIGPRHFPTGASILPPLPADAKGHLTDALRKPPRAQVALTPTGNPITRHDIGTCLPQANDDPSGWLNDNMISAYLDLLTASTSSTSRRSSSPAKAHAFNPFFWTNLRTKGYESVARWSRRAHLDLLTTEWVFIPINHSGAHWTMLVVSGTRRTIQYFDSLHGSAAVAIALIKQWLAGELGGEWRAEDWLVVDTPGPKQSNSNDCGVFAVLSARLVLAGVDPRALKPADMPVWRRRIVAEVLAGAL